MIPITFRNHFYASTSRTRKYPLKALLWALIIQRIFSIPTDQLLFTFLHYSKPLREFCGFNKAPDASKITRFKQDLSTICSLYLIASLALQNQSVRPLILPKRIWLSLMSACVKWRFFLITRKSYKVLQIWIFCDLFYQFSVRVLKLCLYD